jgi:hypothetical protein
MNDNRFTQLGNFADVKQGLATADNKYYIRKRKGVRGGYQILDESKLLTEQEISQLTDDEKLNGVNPEKYNGRCFLPYDKGGESDSGEGWLPNYYVPTQYFIDWSKTAVQRLKTATIADVKIGKGQSNKIKDGDEKKIASRFQNSDYYFCQGLTFSRTGQYAPTYRLNSASVFDTEGSSIFSGLISARAMLALLSSKFARYLIKGFVDHTVHAQVEDIKEFMIPLIDTEIVKKLELLVSKIIEQQKSDSKYPYHLHEQQEIDTIIYQIYGLSNEDIREIELWYCRRYSKLADAQGFLAEVNQKYADYLALCEQNLEQSTATVSSEIDNRVAALYGL